MNKQQAQALQKKLTAAITKVLKEEGLDEPRTKMVWATNGKIKYSVEAIGKEAKDDELITWTQVYGFTYKAGQEFKMAGKTLVLTEYKTRGRKFQWVARCLEDQKLYKLTTDQVKTALK